MFKIKFGKKIGSSKIEVGLRLSLYCLTAVILGTFLFFIFFLYQRFYLTLTQAEEIIILKSQLAVDNIDADALSKIEKLETERSGQIVNWNDLKNPFTPLQ